jgi:hypothetical protein
MTIGINHPVKAGFFRGLREGSGPGGNPEDQIDQCNPDTRYNPKSMAPI